MPIVRPSVTSLATIALCSPALAWQPLFCPTEPWELVAPAGLSAGDQYGAEIATLGDWLFIGAPMDDQSGTDAGAVYVFQLDNGLYEFRQKLLASGGAGPAHFGFSLAVHQDTLIIGAENDREITHSNPNAWGAAYIFQLQNNLWLQQQKLFAFGAGDARQHGWAVAIRDDIAVVGARQIVNDGVNSKGAAYVYRYNGTLWMQEQRLTSDAPTQLDLFGATLALTSDNIVVGSSQNDDLFINAGAVFVFSHDGQGWVQSTKLYAFDAAVNDRFGTHVAAEEQWLVVGAPQNDEAGTDAGAAYLYQFNGTNWSAAGKLLPDAGTDGGNFGVSTAIAGDRLLIGAPTTNPPSQFNAGAAYVARFVNGAWTMERRLTTLRDRTSWGYAPFNCWLYAQQPVNWSPYMDFMKLGLSTAISPVGFLAGSQHAKSKCWDYTGPEASGGVNLFADQYTPPDCNVNGTPDVCDAAPDCNGNFVPDSCELEDQTVEDCNSNSLPDECDIGTQYQLNDGPAEYAFWVSPINGNADFIWLNQFRVKPGGQALTHVAISSSPYLPPNTPITVMVYADPTQDGDPSDAVLLVSVETTAVSFDGNPSVRLMYVPIPPTYLGEPGAFFFIGAVVHALYLNEVSSIPWAAATTATGIHLYQRSWRAYAPPGQADIYDLTNNASPIQIWIGEPFVLRGVAADCNGNGIWDACEIAAGEVPDVNGNGIPDSCDVPDCFFADIAPLHGDGVVNVLDLLEVVNHWGAGSCGAIVPGDTNDDCLINVIDLLAVINGWGPCK